MPLDDVYKKYEGQSILIPGGGKGNNGQCVQWADAVLNEVYGLPYVYTPAALDWWYKADQLGLTQYFDKIPRSTPIKKGDFVIYDNIGRNPAGGFFGHIDVAAQDGTIQDFTAYDSNWGGTAYYKDGYPVLHTVRHNDVYNQYIVGYLRRKAGGHTPAEELTMTPEVAATIDDVKQHTVKVQGQVENLKQLVVANDDAIISYLKKQDEKIEDLKQHILNLEARK